MDRVASVQLIVQQSPGTCGSNLLPDNKIASRLQTDQPVKLCWQGTQQILCSSIGARVAQYVPAVHLVSVLRAPCISWLRLWDIAHQTLLSCTHPASVLQTLHLRYREGTCAVHLVVAAAMFSASRQDAMQATSWPGQATVLSLPARADWPVHLICKLAFIGVNTCAIL